MTGSRHLAPGIALAALVLAPTAFAGTSGLDTGEWLASLVRAFEETPGTFVEKLPRRSGRLEDRSGSCRWKAGSFSTARLSCSIAVAKLDGLKRLDLVRVDPKSPTRGGPGGIPIEAVLSVAAGTARVYLAVDTDLGRLAAALGGGPAPDPPVVRRGYRFAEARPGAPAITHGEGKVFGSQLAVWIEAVDGSAEGLTLDLRPR